MGTGRARIWEGAERWRARDLGPGGRDLMGEGGGAGRSPLLDLGFGGTEGSRVFDLWARPKFARELSAREVGA